MAKDINKSSRRYILIRTIRWAQKNMNQIVQPETDFEKFTDDELDQMAEAKADEQTKWLKEQRDSQTPLK